jgi:hypothetical protein
MRIQSKLIVQRRGTKIADTLHSAQPPSTRAKNIATDIMCASLFLALCLAGLWLAGATAQIV